MFTADPNAISAVPPLRNRPHTAMLKVPRCMRRIRSRSGLAGQPKVLRPIAQSTRNRQPSLANFSATPIPNHIALLETSTAFRSRWFSFVHVHCFSCRLASKVKAVPAVSVRSAYSFLTLLANGDTGYITRVVAVQLEPVGTRCARPAGFFTCRSTQSAYSTQDRMTSMRP